MALEDMKKLLKKKALPAAITITAGLFFFTAFLPEARAAAVGQFLYTLANFDGTVPYNWVRIFPDRERKEIYVSDGSVSIFNASGMLLYSFGDDGSLGNIQAAAVDKDGNILLLSYLTYDKYVLTLCNYRGEPISTIELKNVPRQVPGTFFPDEMVYRNGHIFLVDRGGMAVVETDTKGNFEKFYDLFATLKLKESERTAVDIMGFSVDGAGNLYFTVPVYFRAYRLSPDGKLAAFGQRGSSPGKFNIASGIAADKRGNIFVVDKLKCAVLVFDKNFNFLTQFGYWGFDPGNLISPDDVVVMDDTLYVSQSRSRGVNVYRVVFN